MNMKTIKIGDYVEIRTSLGENYVIRGTITKYNFDWIELSDRDDKKTMKIIRVLLSKIVFIAHDRYGEK